MKVVILQKESGPLFLDIHEYCYRDFEVTYGHQEEVRARLLYHILLPFEIPDLLSCFNCGMMAIVVTD